MTARSNSPAKTIDHTPRDETVRIYTGNAFDLTGERRRTNYIVEMGKKHRDRILRDQSPQPQERAGGCPRGRAPVSRPDLGYRFQFRRLQENRQRTP
jgi:hypothetical protein